MSGQLNDKALHLIFSQFLDLIIEPTEDSVFLKEKMDEDFITLLKDSGVESWLDLYELEPSKLFERMMGVLQDTLDIKLPEDPTDPTEIMSLLVRAENNWANKSIHERKEVERIAGERRIPSAYSLKGLKLKYGGVDETRTRDLLRDRQAF